MLGNHHLLETTCCIIPYQGLALLSALDHRFPPWMCVITPCLIPNYLVLQIISCRCSAVSSSFCMWRSWTPNCRRGMTQREVGSAIVPDLILQAVVRPLPSHYLAFQWPVSFALNWIESLLDWTTVFERSIESIATPPHSPLNWLGHCQGSWPCPFKPNCWWYSWRTKWVILSPGSR